MEYLVSRWMSVTACMKGIVSGNAVIVAVMCTTAYVRPTMLALDLRPQRRKKAKALRAQASKASR